ncbi:Neural cell adhesion molecule 1, partial [Paramuricea clavata]
MDGDAERICKRCHGCQVVGDFRAPEPMQRTEPPSGPWKDVAIDLLGPLPSGENLLVISDNGAQFVSEEFEDFLTESGIQHRKSPPLWPQANGEVERENRTLLKSLKVAHVENKKWKDELNKFLLAYRTTPHSTTGVSPAFMMFGRELTTKLPELRPDKNILNESIRDRDWNKEVAGKEYADKHRQANQNPINPGEKVLLKNSKTSGKLDPKFETKPYIVQTKEGQELTVKSDEGVADKQTIPNDSVEFATALRNIRYLCPTLNWAVNFPKNTTTLVNTVITSSLIVVTIVVMLKRACNPARRVYDGTYATFF